MSTTHSSCDSLHFTQSTGYSARIVPVPGAPPHPGGVLPKSLSASDVGQTFLSAGSGDFPVPGFRAKLSALVREVGKLRNRQARKPALQFGQHVSGTAPVRSSAFRRFGWTPAWPPKGGTPNKIARLRGAAPPSGHCACNCNHRITRKPLVLLDDLSGRPVLRSRDTAEGGQDASRYVRPEARRYKPGTVAPTGIPSIRHQPETVAVRGLMTSR